MYKQITIQQIDGAKAYIIRDNGNGGFTSFSADPANTDYQAYLKWLEEGNTPEPTEEQ